MTVPEETAQARLQVPPGLPGASKSWRKTVTAVDPSKPGGFAVIGEFVETGATYASPAGGLLLGVDDLASDTVVTLWQITGDGEPAEIKRLVRKGKWSGPATIKAVASLLARHPWRGGKPMRLARAANTVAGECRRCHQPVAAGVGVQEFGERGRLVIEHHPACPPAPQARNRYAGPCWRCQGWLEAGEGVLVAGGSGMSGMTAVHEGTCPPPEQRREAPPRANDRTGQCARCGQTVLAGAGFYHPKTRSVTHSGDCPPYPGYTGPTWRASYGRPGRFSPRPERGFRDGQVLRATVWGTADQPVPAATPGYRVERDTGATRPVSAVFTVVGELPPVYCRDEDGDNPAALIGEDGWYFVALVRPAAAGEAVDILDREAREERRTRLARRAAVEITRLDCAERDRPDVVDTDLLALPGVRVEPKPNGASLAFAASFWAYIHLRVDEANGWVWTLTYNGADGDDWSANNYHTYIACRLPLTAQRAELVRLLGEEFGTL